MITIKITKKRVMVVGLITLGYFLASSQHADKAKVNYLLSLENELLYSVINGLTDPKINQVVHQKELDAKLDYIRQVVAST